MASYIAAAAIAANVVAVYLYARSVYYLLWPVVNVAPQTQLVEIKIFRVGDGYSATVNKGSDKWQLTTLSYSSMVREIAARVTVE